MIDRPKRIALTSGISESGVEGKYPHYSIPTAYSNALYKAGADMVFVLPYTKKRLDSIINNIDGLVLTGGIDIEPENYGQKRKEYTDRPNRERDFFEINLTKAALERNIPILGICRGLQILNIVFGGTLYQDLLKESSAENIHNNCDEKNFAHSVEIVKYSILDTLTKSNIIQVNSNHHQGINKLGGDLRAVAISQDGIIEAIESKVHKWVVGVQWHPEILADEIKFHQNIFNSFLEYINR